MSKNYLTPGAIVSAVALIIMILTMSALAYIFLFEKPSLRYLNLPFPVLQNPIYAGDILPLRVSRCSDADARRVITSTRYLDSIGEEDDQEVLALDTITAIIPPGCVTQTVKIHRIPASTAPGNYRLIGSIPVPGMIRDFQIRWYSEPFQVISKPDVFKPLQSPP